MSGSEEPRFKGDWAAGQITQGQQSAAHNLAAVHIVARCECGAAFMSTDGSIAVHQVVAHIVDTGQSS